MYPSRIARLTRMDDVVELPPEDRDEQRRPREREPEWRRDPEGPREKATNRRSDHHPADDRDAVDPAHAAEQLIRDRALPDHGRRRAPDECVRPEDNQRRKRNRG